MKLVNLFETTGLRLSLDERFPPEKDNDVVIARSVAESKCLIKQRGFPVFITFDHDLDENQPTGFDFAKWIVDQDLESNYNLTPDCFTFCAHSQNPIGKRNIEKLLKPYLFHGENNKC